MGKVRPNTLLLLRQSASDHMGKVRPNTLLLLRQSAADHMVQSARTLSCCCANQQQTTW
jgi:hypothetical protein